MSNALKSRIAVLEAKNPEPLQRVVRIVSGEGQEAEARRLLQSQGFDPDGGDLLVIRRCIVSPAGQEPWSDPPFILGATDKTGKYRRVRHGRSSRG